MSDPRITPDPARVAFQKPAQITKDVVNLCRSPDGPRDRQLLFGDPVMHLADAADCAYVQSDKDGYCGYIRRQQLGPRQTASHWVSALATHAYIAPDIKSTDQATLSFGSTLCVTKTDKDFAETALGWVPLAHLSPVGETLCDPAKVAALFLGTPYLWGGNSRLGLDCSGLIQAAFLACGLDCPGDSDMQMALGVPATPPYQRNDLLFWKGHVALVTSDKTMIHANAHAMAITCEPIEDAIARIAKKGDGPVTAHRRLPALSGLNSSLPEA